ncbi:MAG: 16S rRNA (cytosine(1402)-N(4))-methyltransferase RsmH [Bacillota bacterium]|nr:16S rRNA (cytosine(1402)-N(4))-methyltransferase RsmH [Bacillota bacterium]
MSFKHETVMMLECIQGLNIHPGGVYVDGTLGGGGHSFKIAQQLTNGILISIDKDDDALRAGGEKLKIFGEKVRIEKGDFADVDEVLKRVGIEKIDGCLLDLGCSSYQFDTPERGFSYMNDGPLDMRMNRDAELSAYDVVNDYDREELAKVIKLYGEERWADRIAEFIVRERPIRTTFELVEVIKMAIPASARRTGPHPAKRTFQAIRIEVNNELGAVRKAIENIIPRLAAGGRLCIISFHSLEDRIVKHAFKDSGEKIITKRPIEASEEEVERNPRSRSAKLRILEKI